MANRTRTDTRMVRKLLVLGDGAVGKTSLLNAFKGDPFNPPYLPHVAHGYSIAVEVDGKSFQLDLYDSSGNEDYSRLRPLAYPGTDVFLLCFSIDMPSSASNVVDVYNPEIRHLLKGLPITVILVACKIDLRTDPSTLEKMKEQGQTLVTSELGRQIAAEIKADAYMECSSKTREGITDLFTHAARLAIKHQLRTHSRRKRSCFLC